MTILSDHVLCEVKKQKNLYFYKYWEKDESENLD